MSEENGTCGVCGRVITDWFFGPPKVVSVSIGYTDGMPVVRHVTERPILLDPRTGGVCWCPRDWGKR